MSQWKFCFGLDPATSENPTVLACWYMMIQSCHTYGWYLVLTQNQSKLVFSRHVYTSYGYCRFEHPTYKIHISRSMTLLLWYRYFRADLPLGSLWSAWSLSSTRYLIPGTWYHIAEWGPYDLHDLAHTYEYVSAVLCVRYRYTTQDTEYRPCTPHTYIYQTAGTAVGMIYFSSVDL